MRRKYLALVIGAAALHSLQAGAQDLTIGSADNPLDVDVEEYLSRIQLPDGFRISVYASGLEDARSLAMGEDGTLYVGTRGDMGDSAVGKVYAIPDADGDGVGDEVITITEGLFFPNGVALMDGDLYVAEINRILRYDNIAENLRSMPEPAVVSDAFSDIFHHGWKHIDFGPDGKLYVPVGAPCNTCEVEELFGTITRMNPDGSELEIVAHGVRNSVGFDWHPETGELWFTDNGRDLWGNDRPPEELNRVTEVGQHFGFPYRYGKDLVDEQYPTDKDESAFTPAALELPPHTAGLGIEFYTGEMFPEEYRNQLFGAYHGSWNRNPPQGYNILLMRFDDNGEVQGYEEFATGWLIGEEYWGRPVDIAQAPDGALLISDDHNEVIYRISYGD